MIKMWDVRCLTTLSFILSFGQTTANTRTKEMCRSCLPFVGCDTCNATIICDTGTRIIITVVEYRDTGILCWDSLSNCGTCCYRELQISNERKESIMNLCNNKHTCNLHLWNPNKLWVMNIKYVCESSIAASSATTTMVVSTSSAQNSLLHETTTGTTIPPRSTTPKQVSPMVSAKPIREVTISYEDNKSDKIPVTTLAASITAGITVLVIVLVGVVYIKRRQATNSGQNNTNGQRNGGNVVKQTSTNRAISPPGNNTNPRKAAALIAIKQINTNQNNPLHNSSDSYI